MQPFEMGDQLRLTGPTAQVETEHLIGAFGRRASDPQADQQAGDQGHIDLHPHTIGRLTQQVSAAQHTFTHRKNSSTAHRYLYANATSSASRSSRFVTNTITSGAPSAFVLPVATCTRRNGCGSNRVWCAVPNRRSTTSRSTPAARAAAETGAPLGPHRTHWPSHAPGSCTAGHAAPETSHSRYSPYQRRRTRLAAPNAVTRHAPRRCPL